MKVLANVETLLINQTISYHLPHLAVELTLDNQEVLQDGQLVSFTTFLFNFTARVFKPGDGTRLILKDFKVDYITVFKPSFLSKIFHIFFARTNAHMMKSYQDVQKDLTHFFQTSGPHALFLGKVHSVISSTHV